MTYTPRTTRPDNSDLRWRAQTAGGYNNFPDVSTRWGTLTPYAGSVLANCTGYAQGRWMEIGGTSTPYAFSGNAGDWLNEAKTAGYETGTEPREGAILVFSGHVCVVEEVDGDTIHTSDSAFPLGSSGFIFDYVTRTRANGWQRAGGTAGTFLGFVYHPGIQPEPEPTRYPITVTNGTASKTEAEEGETITVAATIPRGYHLQRWEANGIALSSVRALSFSFTMPANAVDLTAVIAKNKTRHGKALQWYRGGWI